MEVFPIQRNMPGFPPPCMTLRSRREVNTRDHVNSLHVEQWQTDGPFLQLDRPDVSGQAYFMDTNPINTRTLDRNYIQNQPYIPGNGSSDQLGQNPYFNKFDVAGDSRNVVRELRSVVSEDIVDRGLRESQKFLQRELESRWLPPQYAEQKGIDVLSMMRPSLNDMKKQYK